MKPMDPLSTQKHVPFKESSLYVMTSVMFALSRVSLVTLVLV